LSTEWQVGALIAYRLKLHTARKPDGVEWQHQLGFALQILSFLITKRREYMKSIVVSIAVATGLLIASSAMAGSFPADLPKDAKKCTACHNVDNDKKKVGPGWVAVGQKYAGKADAVATISKHIAEGGKFGWNFGTMPPKGGNSHLSDADITAIATHIAGLK